MEVHKGEHKFEKIYHEVVEKDSDYSVLPSDAGVLLVGTKSGAAITFTLPPGATSKGCVWEFIQTKDQNLVITGPANSIVAKHNATADTVTFSTATEKIGAAARVICDGSKHYFFNISGCTDGDGSG